MSKTCRDCGLEKPLTEFHRNKGMKDGYAPNCKDCRHNYFKEWYARPGVRDRQLERMRRWRNQPHIKKRAKRKDREYQKKLRLEAMRKISGLESPVCASCGCDDFRLLEINHKNGGGRKEVGRNSKNFYRAIRDGKRKTSDLNVLCRVCNIKHGLELRFGRLPFKVVWRMPD